MEIADITRLSSTAWLKATSGMKAGRQPDVLFTHCNGKHRLHVVVKAMRAASVPVYALTDLDI